MTFLVETGICVTSPNGLGMRVADLMRLAQLAESCAQDWAERVSRLRLSAWLASVMPRSAMSRTLASCWRARFDGLSGSCLSVLSHALRMYSSCADAYPNAEAYEMTASSPVVAGCNPLPVLSISTDTCLTRWWWHRSTLIT